VESNIATLRTADISFSCLLCLHRQRLQKIDISRTWCIDITFHWLYL